MPKEQTDNIITQRDEILAQIKIFGEAIEKLKKQRDSMSDISSAIDKKSEELQSYEGKILNIKNDLSKISLEKEQKIVDRNKLQNSYNSLEKEIIDKEKELKDVEDVIVNKQKEVDKRDKNILVLSDILENIEREKLNKENEITNLDVCKNNKLTEIHSHDKEAAKKIGEIKKQEDVLASLKVEQCEQNVIITKIQKDVISKRNTENEKRKEWEKEVLDFKNSVDIAKKELSDLELEKEVILKDLYKKRQEFEKAMQWLKQDYARLAAWKEKVERFNYKDLPAIPLLSNY